MNFGEKLKKARTAANVTQSELAESLGTTANTISNWENNVSKPDLDKLSYICGILHVTASYFLQPSLPDDEVSMPELKMIKRYRDLDEHGKKVIDFLLESETVRVQDNKKRFTVVPTSKNENVVHYMDYYRGGASAGPGMYHLQELKDGIEVPASELSARADYVIDVQGNSMEPLYYDGDKVFVTRHETVEVGDIGVFMKNGCAYIKKRGEQELISLNGENIRVSEVESVYCYGKVLGKVEDKKDLYSKFSPEDLEELSEFAEDLKEQIRTGGKDVGLKNA